MLHRRKSLACSCPNAASWRADLNRPTGKRWVHRTPSAPKGQNEIAQGRAKRRPGYGGVRVDAPRGSALSGLGRIRAHRTQGVALGYHLAPRWGKSRAVSGVTFHWDGYRAVVGFRLILFEKGLAISLANICVKVEKNLAGPFMACKKWICRVETSRGLPGS